MRHKGYLNRDIGSDYPYCALWKLKAWSKSYFSTRVRNGNGRKVHRLVHVLVAEHYLGRKLEKDEVVHHRDGDGFNNRRENLVVMKRSEHYKLGVHTVTEPEPF